MDNHKGRIGVVSKQHDIMTYPTSSVETEERDNGNPPILAGVGPGPGSVFFVEIDVFYSDYNLGKTTSQSQFPMEVLELPSFTVDPSSRYSRSSNISPSPSTSTSALPSAFAPRSSRPTHPGAIVPLPADISVDEFDIPAVWKRGLIVDDVASNRKMLGRIVKARFEALDYAVNGQEAVDLVAATVMNDVERVVGMHGYDIIFMDCNMPIMVRENI
jgi:CheY-like chemotaxis protein